MPDISIFSVWPMMAIVGLVVVALSGRFLRFLDVSPTVFAHRLDSIDGLRGILATAVAFHHFVLHGYGAKFGVAAPSHFYMSLGPAAVAIFFMITGYLFWSRLLAKADSVNWAELYVNRFFRIYPLYLFLIASYFAVVLCRVHFEIDQPFKQTVFQIGQWLALGVVKNPTPFLNMDAAMSVVGPVWSLRYEWLFYASLPILSIFARLGRPVALTASALFLVLAVDGLIAEPFRSFLAEFLCGMLASSIMRTRPALKGDGAIRSIIACALIVAAFRVPDIIYSPVGTLLLGGFFMMIVSGTSIFGVLQTRGAHRLGNMSYSVYLLHSLVITMVMTRPAIVSYALGNNSAFWITCAFMYVTTVAMSVATFSAIERVGISIGKAAITRLNRASDVHPGTGVTTGQP